MNLTQNTCSRELAEEMARLGICQDGAELWRNPVKQFEDGGCLLSDKKNDRSSIIAPTLVRMMEELPIELPAGYLLRVTKLSDGWYIHWTYEDREGSDDHQIESHDEQLPNAVARALIAIKKGA